ncbi:hypothetical protein TELCIR_03874 [Teladorsagia circumcincta]|uniref:glucuronosyltransferase n=1 Tax=Teladorsagia circumcincta TaxID=45464 RepID=A0A2G9UVD2_TELCI|nr:hypothetical protein TELCIR_03874 [Teladorsagia circumcincta]
MLLILLFTLSYIYASITTKEQNRSGEDVYFVNVATSGEFDQIPKDVFRHHGIITDEEYYKSKINYLLSNTDEFLVFGRPLSPKIVHIGGITLLKAASLSEELQKIVEQAKMGVVYISFGSTASTKAMPKSFRDAIIEVTKIFKEYDFIWKVDEEAILRNPTLSPSFALQLQQQMMVTSTTALLGDNGTMQMLANEHFDAGITEMESPETLKKQILGDEEAVVYRPGLRLEIQLRYRDQKKSRQMLAK